MEGTSTGWDGVAKHTFRQCVAARSTDGCALASSRLVFLGRYWAATAAPWGVRRFRWYWENVYTAVRHADVQHVLPRQRQLGDGRTDWCRCAELPWIDA